MPHESLGTPGPLTPEPADVMNLVLPDAIPPDALSFMFEIPERRPALSARRVLSGLQKLLLVLLLAVFAAGLLYSWTLTLIVLNGCLLAFYLALSLYKFYLIHVALRTRREMDFSYDEIAGLADDELPPYTILVPLYKEKETLPRLLAGLRHLDYPKDKLDVIWLMEENDPETRQAARELDPPPWIRSVVVPDCQPKTKPKVCNLGLAIARGRYLVIYDAEDHPEPDQLKKAILGFRHCPDDVVCLQAKLNFYNQRQNLLTRWFTTDYSMWFDIFLPGLDYLESPIPLGGTSNHFRTEKLRELGGWDPHNVTEDCDLGIRLALAGYRTRIIHSTTWEEACSRVGWWIRQRSRWTKGYVQTWLVHERRPFRLLWKLGLRKTLSFHMMVGGTFVCLLINPLYWIMTALWFLLRWQELSTLFPYPLILWGLICLFVGNFVFVYACVLAAYHRGYYDLVKYALAVPAYWVLMSIGAWKGFLQLITRPSYWEKTMHGLDLLARRRRRAAVDTESRNG
jgi:cellulose synthase/poly-beta-1,6-N-acetylglucosamine synthase-like glycosyltransferase